MLLVTTETPWLMEAAAVFVTVMGTPGTVTPELEVGEGQGFGMSSKPCKASDIGPCDGQILRYCRV